MTLHEPATTLTDFFLFAQCVLFAALLLRRQAPGFGRTAFVVLFSSIAAGALLGGLVHGVLPDAASLANRVLWVATLLSLGVTAAAMFAVGTWLEYGSEKARRLIPLLAIGLATYAGVVLFLRQEFVVAIVAYLPAALFLMAVLARDWWVRRNRAAAVGVVGIALALLGAVGQQLGVGLHPVHFDHNAVYHVVQAVALYLLFRAASGLGGSS